MASSVCEVTIKWSGQEYKIKGLTADQRVLDLKNAIQKETGVLPERQKLLNLKHKGKPAEDDVSLSALNLKPKMKIMMMGTREETLKDVMTPPEEMPEVVNDFDIEEDEIAIENREEYLTKIERRIRDYNIEVLNEPRPGKHLLVLDIDYTLFDHKSVAETGLELMRPYLHEFLSSAYEDYDIVIWSATGMKWIKAKMEELGMEKHPHYKLCFYIDSLAMITVHTPKYGVIDVKPLGVIWGKFSQWSPKNTIMFDDIRRNFIMNPQSGLRIKAFRQAHVNRATDRELLKLAKYLKAIAALEDFTDLNHRKWDRVRLVHYDGKRHEHHHRHRRSSDKDKDSDGGNAPPDSPSGSSSNQDSNSDSKTS